MLKREKIRAPTETIEEKRTKAILKEKIRKELEKNPKLVKFLEENHAKGRFIKNLANQVSDSPNRILNISNYDPINSCLIWNSTTEGWSYWNKLCDKYREQH